MPGLFIKGPDGEQKVFLQSPRIRVGRGPESDIQLKDAKVARLHVEILRTQAGYAFKDLTSGNGVRHNGQPSRQGPLKNGDLLEVGDTQIRFAAEQKTAAARPPIQAAPAAPGKTTAAMPRPATAAVRPATGSAPAAGKTTAAVRAAARPPTGAAPVAKTTSARIPAAAPPGTKRSTRAVAAVKPPSGRTRTGRGKPAAGGLKPRRRGPNILPVMIGGAVVFLLLVGGVLLAMKLTAADPNAGAEARWAMTEAKEALTHNDFDKALDRLNFAKARAAEAEDAKLLAEIEVVFRQYEERRRAIEGLAQRYAAWKPQEGTPLTPEQRRQKIQEGQDLLRQADPLEFRGPDGTSVPDWIAELRAAIQALLLEQRTEGNAFTVATQARGEVQTMLGERRFADAKRRVEECLADPRIASEPAIKTDVESMRSQVDGAARAYVVEELRRQAEQAEREQGAEAAVQLLQGQRDKVRGTAGEAELNQLIQRFSGS